jgi:lysyl-tRNA synthetase class 2
MDRQLRRTVAVALRALAVIVAIILVTSMATGWLYWLRAGTAHWPGPLVRQALPLDELPGHDSVPLIVYLAAFGTAAALLGLLGRALRLDRLTAGLSLAVGTGAWLLLVDAFCLFVVRQVPVAQAVRAAVRLQPVYIAAACAGAAGALLGLPVRPGGIMPRLLTWLVAASGLTDLLSALVPRPGRAFGPLELLAPGVLTPAAHILLVPAGVLLLITSRGLARRNHRAWRLALLLLGASVLLHLLRGPGYAAASVTGLIALALLARRDDFPYRGDPGAEQSALWRLLAMVLLATGYGVAAVWVSRTAADLPTSLWSALADTARAMAGLLPSDARYLPRDFTGWFSPSVLSIVAIGASWATWVWLRPWRQRLFPEPQGREQAAEIVRRWGSDTLAPFTLRPDKGWFVTGQTLIAYRVIRGVALVSGDPVGPPQEVATAAARFLAYARERGWRTAILGASSRFLHAYRDLGLSWVYHGDEAVIDTGHFGLDGRRMRTVRQAVHRVQRHGYRAEVVAAGDLLPALEAELAEVERGWLRGRPRKGFTMALDRLLRLGGNDAVFVIGRDAAGRVGGFLHLAVCPASRSLSLSTMPRLPGTPNGFTAWLVTEAVRWARRHGFRQLSLNFSPFAGVLASHAELPPRRRWQRRALLRLKRLLALQLDNLLRFNAQFDPTWVPRYVVFQARADLPRVALAALAAEGYLPGAGLFRRRDRAPAQAPQPTPCAPAPQPTPCTRAPQPAQAPPPPPAVPRQGAQRERPGLPPGLAGAQGQWPGPPGGRQRGRRREQLQGQTAGPGDRHRR